MVAKANKTQQLTPQQFACAMLAQVAAVFNAAALAAGVTPPSGGGNIYNHAGWLQGQRARVNSCFMPGKAILVGTNQALTANANTVQFSFGGCNGPWVGQANQAVKGLSAAYSGINATNGGKYHNVKYNLPVGALTKANAAVAGKALGKALVPYLATMQRAKGGFVKPLL